MNFKEYLVNEASWLNQKSLLPRLEKMKKQIKLDNKNWRKRNKSEKEKQKDRDEAHMDDVRDRRREEGF
jgi:hypothetical protein